MKMARLTQFGINLEVSEIVFSGEFTPSGIKASDGTEYQLGKLLKPVMVGCSTVREMPAESTDELYVRQDIAVCDLWEAKDKEAYEKDPKNYKGGFHIPGYVADFSKNQLIPIYQEQTIAQWAKGQRKDRSEEGKTSFLEKIKARRAQAGS